MSSTSHKHDIGFDVYPDNSSLYGTTTISNSKGSRQAGWGDAKTATQSSYTNTVNHKHSLSMQSNGGGEPHNLIQPYLSVYIWRRTA